MELKFDKQANVWISFCSLFNVYSQGRNKEEAIKALKSAIRFQCIYNKHLCEKLESKGEDKCNLKKD